MRIAYVVSCLLIKINLTAIHLCNTSRIFISFASSKVIKEKLFDHWNKSAIMTQSRIFYYCPLGYRTHSWFFTWVVKVDSREYAPWTIGSSNFVSVWCRLSIITKSYARTFFFLPNTPCDYQIGFRKWIIFCQWVDEDLTPWDVNLTMEMTSLSLPAIWR